MLPQKILALAAVPLAAWTLAVHAADNNKVTIENRMAQCQGCHGIPNWKTAFPEVYRVPKLGGQKAAYIAAALKEYKSGDRDFATMRAVAADLSDADIDQLAKYYGSDSALAAAAPSAPAGSAASAPAAPATAPATGTAPATAPSTSTATSAAPSSPANAVPSTAVSPTPTTAAMPAASGSGNSSNSNSTSKGGKK